MAALSTPSATLRLLRGSTTALLLASLVWAALAPAGAAPPGAVFEGPVPEAHCGRGSMPETGLQGQVPLADRESGRSQEGYRCNLELLGQYQGEGTTWVSQSYDTCAYHSQAVPSSIQAGTPGVNVVDVSDPRNPVLTQRLTSPAFLGGTWESLKVNTRRGLLAGVLAGPSDGVAAFDVYDISDDCAHPRLLNGAASVSIPANAVGHEGNWSPDGRTYWSTSLWGGNITAIDVSDPSVPKLLYTGSTGLINHGLSFSDDGRRLYLADIDKAGLTIFDVSEIQDRKPAPQIHRLGSVGWTDGSFGQHAVPISYRGKPYVVFVDEGGAGAARIIDVSDEMAPVVVAKLKLEIHLPEHAAARAEDTAGNGGFGYEGHYCDVDRAENPTALACGYFQSGVRVFDIRNPLKPREIAYFNPPAQVGQAARLTGSNHATSGADMTADWCSSPPRFVGRDQLWVACQDNGFLTLQFTNGAYPLEREGRR